MKVSKDDDRLNNSNKPKIIASSKTLSKYPDILESKGLGYLKNFVSRSLDDNLDLGDGKRATKLSQAIAMEIPPKERDEIITKANDSKPLAKSRSIVASSLALNINIMDKYSQGDDKSKQGAERAKQGVVKNLKKQGIDEKDAEKFERKLLEVAPLAYGSYASDPNIIKCNDVPHIIVAPKQGEDAKMYREGIQVTENIHSEINSMAQNGIDVERLILLNEEAKKIRGGDQFAVEAMKKFSQQQPKQPSKLQLVLVGNGAELPVNAEIPCKKKPTQAQQR